MKSQIFWIGFVVSMLLMSVVIYGTALIISLTDPTFGDVQIDVAGDAESLR